MQASDVVAVEEPLEIRLGDKPAVVVMRTPGNDAELARGLAFAEGWFDDPKAEVGVTRPAASSLSREERDNVVCLELPPGGRAPAARNMVSKSSCGVCGKTAIAEISMRATPLATGAPVHADVLASLPERLRHEQPLFDETGGVHAAGLFTQEGELLYLREDVGRHNAVDKVVGQALERGWIPADDKILCVSGRVSFEIVQKALMARIPVVVAVSAPTSHAVEIAEQFRMTLCGFARGTNFNIYAHSTRISND